MDFPLVKYPLNSMEYIQLSHYYPVIPIESFFYNDFITEYYHQLSH